VSASRRLLVRLAVRLLALGCCVLAGSAQASGDTRPDGFQHGVEAYRRGDYAGAREAWQQALQEPLDSLGRATVLYDLGNAHWRCQEPLRAIACFEAAVRLDPRHADAWRNLELARARSDLAPADPGDLDATLQRLVSSLRPDERRALLFAALVLWTLVLITEIRFGGGWRTGLAAATLVLGLAAVPWAWGALHADGGGGVVVVASGGVPLRSEPLEERDAVAELAPLEEVAWVDALPGWTRVERRDGTRGWVRAEALYDLRPPEDSPRGDPEGR